MVKITVFNSGLVLLLGIWRGRITGIKLMDEEKELAAVHSCINVLKSYENRWHLAGRFRFVATLFRHLTVGTEFA